MLRLDRVIKPWKESAALNDHINLYGFWNETAFLTKSGDLGMVLSISGVDYESLDRSEQEYAVKRLEAALKAFGPGFHVYQYLFKSNRPDIPFAKYDDPIVEAAIDQRRKFFESKRDHLYQVEIFYCILLEGARSKTGVGTALARLLRDPEGAIGELKSQFTNDSMKTLLRAHIERDVARLDQHVQAFARQLGDFMQVEVLNRQGQFTFFRRLLNYDDWRVAGSPQSTQFLDYQVVNSDIETERDHLRVGESEISCPDIFRVAQLLRQRSFQAVETGKAAVGKFGGVFKRTIRGATKANSVDETDEAGAGHASRHGRLFSRDENQG
jgi:type IV secretion system protein VirB4